MITPRFGAFIHGLRERNDPDHRQRHIDHTHELLGMAPGAIRDLLQPLGFTVSRARFVFGMNNLCLCSRALPAV
jgi:hypothetical protein